MTHSKTGAMPALVAAARNALPGGDDRLVDSTCSLRNAWFPVDVEPSFEEQMLSDHGALHSKNPIAGEFDEEVNALIQAIASRSDSRSLEQVKAEGGEEAMLIAAEDRMGRRPMALALWDRHGAPVRLRGDTVFRVVSPRDVMGDPIIRSYPAHQFVTQVSVRTAELAQHLKETKSSLARWRVTSAGLLFLLALIAWLWVR
jgi:hypothetical protein